MCPIFNRHIGKQIEKKLLHFVAQSYSAKVAKAILTTLSGFGARRRRPVSGKI